MRCIQSIGRGRRLRRGQADWTSAAAPRMARRRWPARDCGVWFAQTFPLRSAFGILPSRRNEVEFPFEDGRASAGSGDSAAG